MVVSYTWSSGQVEMGRLRCTDRGVVSLPVLTGQGRTPAPEPGVGVRSWAAQGLWHQPHIGRARAGQEADKPGPGFRSAIAGLRADRAKGHRVHYLAGCIQ